MRQKIDWRNFIREKRVYLLSFFLPLCIWLGVLLAVGYEPFGQRTLLINDGMHQYFPFLSQYRERISEGSSFLYSFGGGMGFDFWQLFAYYLSSPLNLILVLFPSEWLGSVLNILVVVKMALCGLGFAGYMGMHGKGKDGRVVIYACGYSLCSFLVGYRANLMWIEVIALFPIILGAFEKLIQEGKWKLYTLTLALALWCNFYMTFMVCLFLILWFLLSDFHGLRHFFRRGLQFTGCSILAAGISAMVLLPAYLGVSGTGTFTLSGFELIGRFWEIMEVKNGGILAFSRPVTISNFAYEANLYCGIFTLGLCVLYFMNRKVSFGRRAKMFLLTAFLVISMDVRILNNIWHGFHSQVGVPNRFVFLLIFLMLLFAYEAQVNLEEYHWGQILGVCIGWIALFSLLFYTSDGEIPISSFVPSVILMVMYTFLHIWYQKSTLDRAIIPGILAAAVVIELAASTYYSLRTTGATAMDDYFRQRDGMLEAAHDLEENQNGIWRTEVYNSAMLNEGMAYNLKTTGLFSSMVEVDMVKGMRSIGYNCYSNQYNLRNGTPVIETLFGIRNQLLVKGDKNRFSKGYHEVKSYGDDGVTLYEKEDVLPVGYMIQKEGSSWKVKGKNAFKNQMTILNRMTGQQNEVFTQEKLKLSEVNGVEVEQITDVNFEYSQPEEGIEEHIVLEMVADGSKDLYLKEQDGWIDNTNIYVNDELIAQKDLLEHFYHIGEVEKGDVIRVGLHCRTDWEAPVLSGVSLYLYDFHADELKKAYDTLAQETLEVTSSSDSHVSGKIKVKDDGLLFLTIPYDDNWKLKVDGEEREFQKAGYGFMGVELTAGEHKIELDFSSGAFATGAWLSGISAAAFAGLCLLSKRIRQETKKEEDDVAEKKESGEQPEERSEEI